MKFSTFIVICVYWCLTIVYSDSQQSTDEIRLVILILSQPNPFHEQRAFHLKENLVEQASKIKLKWTPTITISHIPEEGEETEAITTVNGHWAVWPLLKSIIHQSDTSGVGAVDGSLPGEHYWLFVCEEDTQLALDRLIHRLSALDPAQDHLIGYGLVDQGPTIIHHYAFAETGASDFRYPDFSAGLAISSCLVEKLVENIVSIRSDFTIDAKHESLPQLAMNAWQKGSGTRLQHDAAFCLLANAADDCITTYRSPAEDDYDGCRTAAVTDRDVLFAVKTFHEHHKTRVTVVKRTWAKDARHIEYFSDTDDQFIPTVKVTVANTDRGHCAKTWYIFKHFLENEKWKDLKWLVIADDDTLLSVGRLLGLLSCYNSTDALMIGERYGYGFDTDAHGGYDYPTGGSGMVFTRKAVELLVTECGCPSNNSPDDMLIGICAGNNDIPLIHSPAFHQARPEDYSVDYLAKIKAISFHKHWETDPYKNYERYLVDEQDTTHKTHEHEL